MSAVTAPSASAWEAGLVRVEVLFGLGSGRLSFLLPHIKVSDFYQKLHLHITILKDFLSDELTPPTNHTKTIQSKRKKHSTMPLSA